MQDCNTHCDVKSEATTSKLCSSPEYVTSQQAVMAFQAFRRSRNSESYPLDAPVTTEIELYNNNPHRFVQNGNCTMDVPGTIGTEPYNNPHRFVQNEDCAMGYFGNNSDTGNRSMGMANLSCMGGMTNAVAMVSNTTCSSIRGLGISDSSYTSMGRMTSPGTIGGIPSTSVGGITSTPLPAMDSVTMAGYSSAPTGGMNSVPVRGYSSALTAGMNSVPMGGMIPPPIGNLTSTRPNKKHGTATPPSSVAENSNLVYMDRTSDFGPIISSSCAHSSNDSYRIHDLDSGVSYSGDSCKINKIHNGADIKLPRQPDIGSPTMSLWAKVQQLPPEALRRVQSAYGSHFPIEVRHYFAQWIEEQPWRQIDENEQAYEVYATQLFESLKAQLESKINELPMTQDSFLVKIGLQDTVKKLQEMYSSCPLRLVSVVKGMLDLEESLVQEAENPHINMETLDDSSQMNRQIEQEIDALQNRTQMTETHLKQLQNNQESFIIQYQSSLTVNTQIQQLKSQATQNHNTVLEKLVKQKEETEKQLMAKAGELLKSRIELAAKHEETFLALDELQKKVVDKELISWKRKQQLSGNGAFFDSKMLLTLQNWCEALAEMIWKNRQQVLQVEILCQRLPIRNDGPDIFPELNQKITGLLSSLVTSTFIVEAQPPQVLKKESRFTATVRLLVGGKLNIHMTPPQVKATIISENQARGLLKNDAKAKEETSGEILNNAGTMEYHQGKGELSITFRNMQLKKIKRADKKGSEAVTEEKFCVLFQSDFQIGNGELMFQVWTLSLPVVVTVHGNQECNAMATVLWDNQFAEPGRTPFQVPDNVPWSDVIEMLNCKFLSMTGRGLSEDSKNYLASKVFGVKDDYSKLTMSWTNFNKDTLTGRSFTFWEWFYAVMKLTKEHLKNPWVDGSIIGFISKAKAQDWLLNKPNGTFLLRFSDSESGGITIAWVADDPNKQGSRQVWNLHPYCARDFGIRSLSDRIKDLPSLVCLYPNIPKETAFGKYFSCPPEVPKRGDGYVPAGIMATILDNGTAVCPPVNASPMNYDNPQTPHASDIVPDSPASTVNPLSPVSPQTVTSQLDPIEETDMEAIQSILNSVVTDYNADDINEMNVSEFLLTFTPGQSQQASG